MRRKLIRVDAALKTSKNREEEQWRSGEGVLLKEHPEYPCYKRVHLIGATCRRAQLLPACLPFVSIVFYCILSCSVEIVQPGKGKPE